NSIIQYLSLENFGAFFLSNINMKRIAIQGIQGAFHEIAAIQYFGNNIETVNCEKFKQIFELVSNGSVHYGVVAIENTIAGSLLGNYNLLKESKVKIIGELSLHITQNLMALPGTTIETIREIYSHPIAIQQSMEFLSNYPHIKLIEWSDTASSAQKIATEQLHNTGAIASKYAAELYGLQILASEIETHKMNYTRFLIIQRNSHDVPENNKASLCFELGHQPGSLVDVLTVFKNEEINLTKIQSLPILGRPYQYSFYIDLEWKDRARYDIALNKALKIVSNLSVLGEYVRDEKFNHEMIQI
ncbi:MAG TPA: prephenate dehydratase, partial [Bacteroidales bacterium]|nr:prephenate dehydratase [Bacteroidales bacterium]